jgi:NAD(P)-dependent dehydrogenase (short-subunit alcohol dehydrogenase family)
MDNKYPDCNENNNNELTHQVGISVAYDIVTCLFIVSIHMKVENVAVVTGSSTGIGYETSLILARNGFLTYATMRNLNKNENIKLIATRENLPLDVIQLDVTDDTSVKNAIQAISSETGRIDVLVNNAGYGLNGAFEDLAMDEIKAQYETNVFGLIRTNQAVLPIMRRQKSGTIVNISSSTSSL